MTDTPTTTPQPDPSQPTSGKPRRGCKGRGAWFFVILLSAGAVIGVFATKALSHGPGGWHGKWHHGSGFTRVHGPMGFMRGPLDVDKAQKRAERMVKHIGIEIDATDEQTVELVRIAKALVRDIIPVRQELRTARRAAVDILTSENPDQAELEKLRADQMTRFDDASKRVLAAITEANAVLTPAQRTQIRERIEKRRKRGHWFWHGRHAYDDDNGDDDRKDD